MSLEQLLKSAAADSLDFADYQALGQCLADGLQSGDAQTRLCALQSLHAAVAERGDAASVLLDSIAWSTFGPLLGCLQNQDTIQLAAELVARMAAAVNPREIQVMALEQLQSHDAQPALNAISAAVCNGLLKLQSANSMSSKLGVHTAGSLQSIFAKMQQLCSGSNSSSRDALSDEQSDESDSDEASST